MATEKQSRNLQRLLFPNSIAIVGASAAFEKAGSQLVHALRSFPGHIFPINPKESEIQGFKAYPNLAALPCAPDLVAVAVPARATASVISEATFAGAGGALVVGGGFAESGPEGEGIQAEVAAAMSDSSMRLLGPNTSGFFNPAGGCFATFAPGTETIPAGAVAVVAQSGGVNLTLSFMLARAGLGVSLAVGLGNAMDIDASDVLELLASHDETKVIALHIEGVTLGRRLYETLLRVTPRKPVVVLTVGRADSGAFAQSHTGALLGTFEVKVAALRQAGAVVVDTSDELVAACAALSTSRLPAKLNPGIVLVTAQAGPGLLIIDNLLHRGASMPELQPETVARIEGLLPPITYIRNPVDTGRPSPTFPEVLSAVAADPGIDLVLVSALNEPEVLDPGSVLSASKTDKPILFSGLGALGAVDDVLAKVRAAGFAAYLSPEQMVSGALALVEDAKTRSRPAMTSVAPSAPILAGGTVGLDEAEAKAILASAGIRTPARTICADRQSAHAALASMGGKVVVKVIDSAILHKSDVGGVHVGIATADDLDVALDAIDAIEGPHRTYLLEEMADPGLELIAGAVRDASFGPVVLVGLGGVTAEAIRDVSRRIAPISRNDALMMLDELKGRALLDGWRGEPRVDRSAIADVLVALSDLIVANPSIAEVEINPLRAYAEGCVALDALIVGK